MLKIYDTFSKSYRKFRPIKKKKVGIYTCGPTVYSFAHIGNFRSYLVSDIIRRYLEQIGYKVKKIVNITDVGHLTSYDISHPKDKIIEAAKKAGRDPFFIARFYEKAFLKDEEKLNIKKANVYPRATEHIREMQKLIKILLRKGYAYFLKDGIYFHLPKFKRYGLLSGNTLEKLKKGVRIEPNPLKKHPADFALWKFAPKTHLMKWSSPWGIGFPGWHIECSAMAMKYLGERIDIHTGGEDNIFPHHENEIAQSEAITEKKFVNYWIHTKHLLVEGEKMAKSKGNVYTISDLEKRGFHPISFRLLCLTTHHRKKLNFTFKKLAEAEKNLEKISDFIENLKKIKKEGINQMKNFLKDIKKEFKKAMDDDFNTSKALAVVFKLIKEGNRRLLKENLSKKEAKEILNTLKELDKVLGIFFIQKKKIPQKIIELVKARERLRKEKKWTLADKIRKKIEKMGYQIKDTKRGPKISRKFNL